VRRVSRIDRLAAEQVDFLRASAERFDAGYEHEAKRLALCIRVLLHDAGKSVSLLGQAGLKATLRFVDSRFQIEGLPGTQVLMQQAWPGGMVRLRFGGDARPKYVPVLGAKSPALPSKEPFDVWWEGPIVVSADGIQQWSRSHFVLGPANKEGGAHVDPAPSAWWVSLRDEDWVGAGTVETPAGPTPVGNLVPAVVRQVAYELLETLEQQASLPSVGGRR
jgi:hypothetical protein